ncbi:MAG: AraC family transcriptional regulator [Clostridia bacterium]|nr:AraC family transcriptional regulator [Clostridia bacterium]
MNIYKKLNQSIEYIENNLENNIETKRIAQILEMNEQLAQNIFYCICGISISEYVRNRRLSNAGFDLYNTNMSIVDIAVKYQYTSATSFSRAFEKFHNIKPSQIKNGQKKLRVYSRIKLQEIEEKNSSIEYEIIDQEQMELYGTYIETTIEEIRKVAPDFWFEIYYKYKEKYGDIDYGMTSYDNRFECNKCKYWVLYKNKVNEKEFQKVILPKSKWIVFKTKTQDTKEIQETTQKIYKEFIPSTKYKFKELPELEYYHNNIVEIMMPLEEN